MGTDAQPARFCLDAIGRRRILAMLFAVCSNYAVASVPMFKVTKVPFTVRLLTHGD